MDILDAGVISPVNNRILRHRWELPMLAVCIVITLGMFSLSIASAVWGNALVPDEIVGDTLHFALFLPVLAGFIFIYRFYKAAGIRANSVKAGPDQFPELYALYTSLAKRLGIKNIPGLYVVNGNGAVNAYAFSCNTSRGYVVIHAEISRLLQKDPAVVEFVLAHELGHHKLGHVRWWRLVVNVIPGFFFLPGKFMTRAEEYSADRAAASVCENCARCVGLLTVGPFLQHEVKESAFEAQAIEEDRSWFVRAQNWVVDHAVNTKRYRALKAIERSGFEEHGRMFL